MTSTPDPSQSIVHFAELSAGVDDPFADRAAVLARAGLDDDGWMRLNERWLNAFCEPGGDLRAARFGEVFRKTRAQIAAGVAPRAESGEPAAPGPRFLSPEAQPWRGEAAGVGDSRASSPPLLTAPRALAGAPVAAPAASPPPSPAPSAMPLLRGATAHPLAGTTDVDPRALGAEALPFAAPAAEDLKGTLPAGARADEIWPFPNRDPGASR
jgi:hypothetical protein